MARVIIDVRQPMEFKMGHVKGALNIPPSKLMDGPSELAELPRDTELVVYCLSGSRSNASIPFLKAMGFTNIVNGINKHHVERNYPPLT
ncbi:MAG: rhodanese-like domain-containing protein [Candidatus Saccharimonadales bacterium]